MAISNGLLKVLGKKGVPESLAMQYGEKVQKGWKGDWNKASNEKRSEGIIDSINSRKYNIKESLKEAHQINTKKNLSSKIEAPKPLPAPIIQKPVMSYYEAPNVRIRKPSMTHLEAGDPLINKSFYDIDEVPKVRSAFTDKHMDLISKHKENLIRKGELQGQIDRKSFEHQPKDPEMRHRDQNREKDLTREQEKRDLIEKRRQESQTRKSEYEEISEQKKKEKIEREYNKSVKSAEKEHDRREGIPSNAVKDIDQAWDEAILKQKKIDKKNAINSMEGLDVSSNDISRSVDELYSSDSFNNLTPQAKQRAIQESIIEEKVQDKINSRASRGRNIDPEKERNKVSKGFDKHFKKRKAEEKLQQSRAASSVSGPHELSGEFEDMKKHLSGVAIPQGYGGKYGMNAAIEKAMGEEKVLASGNTKAFAKMRGISEEDALIEAQKTRAERMADYEDRVINRATSPTFGDNMMGHKVPHLAVGAMGTVGLVSMMSGTKGQQTNAQLYGQQPYY